MSLKLDEFGFVSSKQPVDVGASAQKADSIPPVPSANQAIQNLPAPLNGSEPGMGDRQVTHLDERAFEESLSRAVEDYANDGDSKPIFNIINEYSKFNMLNGKLYPLRDYSKNRFIENVNEFKGCKNGIAFATEVVEKKANELVAEQLNVIPDDALEVLKAFLTTELTQSMPQLQEKQREGMVEEQLEDLQKRYKNKSEGKSLNEKIEIMSEILKDEFDFHIERLKSLNSPMVRMYEAERAGYDDPSVCAGESVARLGKLISSLDNYCQKADERFMYALEEGFRYYYNNNFDSLPKLHGFFNGSDYSWQLPGLIDEMGSFVENNKDKLSDREIKVFGKCIAKLQFAKQLYDQAIDINWVLKSKFSSPTEEEIALYAEPVLNQIVDQMLEKIKSLDEGESCVFCGGTKRHAIMFQFIKEAKGGYSFNVINTGADEVGYSKRAPHFKELRGLNPNDYRHKSYKIPESLVNAEFLTKICPIVTHKTATSEFIQQLDGYLMPQGAIRQEGRLHQPQTRGNCVAKSSLSYIKDDLSRELKGGLELYQTFKLFKGQHNYDDLLIYIETLRTDPSLKGSLNLIFGDRTYADHDPTLTLEERDVDPKCTIEPVSDEQVEKELKELHDGADLVMKKWAEKAENLRRASR